MNNNNIIIIILICIVIALSVLIASTILFNQNQTNQPINSTNNTSTSINVEKINQEDESSSSASSSNNGIHREHLNGGDVAVDSNGMVVGHYKSNGEYVEGGQLGGMSIEDARAFDERASKYGLQ